jgi:HK97 family phage prohead protease
MEKFLKLFRAEVKEINKDDFTLTAVISTKKTDRDGDIVMPDAFNARIKTYKDHPVLLSSHNYSKLTNQIGKAEKVEVGDNQVVAKFKYFVGEGNPEADWAWVLAQKGIASYSVGFMGHQFDWIKEKDGEGAERITGRKFTDIELLEVSQVLIPSNRGALQEGRAFAQESVELCEMAIKGLTDEDFPIAPKVAVKEVKNTDPHYLDELLGKEGLDPKSAPQSKELSVADITVACKEAVTEVTSTKEKI